MVDGGAGTGDRSLGSATRPDVSWWRAADGRFYPPELHPNYAALQEELAGAAPPPVSRPTGVSGSWIVGAVALVAVVGVAAALMWSVTDNTRRTDDLVGAAQSANRDYVDRLMHQYDLMPDTGLVDRSAGDLVFDDDFTEPAEGWPVQADDGAAYELEPSAYVVRSTAPTTRTVDIPRQQGEFQTSVTAAATVTAPPESAGEAGFGVGCQKSGAQFRLVGRLDGSWTLSHYEHFGDELVEEWEGTVAAPPGAGPSEVQLMCATFQDALPERVVGFIDGEMVVDERIDVQVPGGWNGLLATSGTSTEVHFSSVQIRAFAS